ncbi:hypothetical protein B484DRAFT_392809 [Ochromonadaceae sp. CCMP2298]|nr:hypothetical protein B484DRAFT_392809 [Ochromonadaceae sp. CCMP2298]
MVRGDKAIDVTWDDAMTAFYEWCPAWLDDVHTRDTKVVLFDEYPNHSFMRVVRIQTTKVCAGHATVVALHIQRCIKGEATKTVLMPDLSHLYLKLNVNNPRSFLKAHTTDVFAIGVNVFLQAAYGNAFKETYRLSEPTSEEFKARLQMDCGAIMNRLRTSPAILSFEMGKDFLTPGSFSFSGQPSIETERIQTEYKSLLHTVVLSVETAVEFDEDDEEDEYSDHNSA